MPPHTIRSGAIIHRTTIPLAVCVAAAVAQAQPVVMPFDPGRSSTLVHVGIDQRAALSPASPAGSITAEIIGSPPVSVRVLAWSLDPGTLSVIVPFSPFGQLPVYLDGLRAFNHPAAQPPPPLAVGQEGALATLALTPAAADRVRYEALGPTCVNLDSDGLPCTLNTALSGGALSAELSAGRVVQTPQGVELSGVLTVTLAPMAAPPPPIGLEVRIVTTFVASADSAGGACPADFDASGLITADDIFVFLSAWFAAGPGQSCPGCSADFDQSGVITADDIFVFLSAWFAAGPGLPCP